MTTTDFLSQKKSSLEDVNLKFFDIVETERHKIVEKIKIIYWSKKRNNWKSEFFGFKNFKIMKIFIRSRE